MLVVYTRYRKPRANKGGQVIAESPDTGLRVSLPYDTALEPYRNHERVFRHLIAEVARTDPNHRPTRWVGAPLRFTSGYIFLRVFQIDRDEAPKMAHDLLEVE